MFYLGILFKSIVVLLSKAAEKKIKKWAYNSVFISVHNGIYIILYM